VTPTRRWSHDRGLTGLLAANGAQAAGAFAATFVLARQFELSVFADWGLQQVLFQVLGPVLSLGLSPVLSAVNVSSSGTTAEAQAGVSRLRASLATVVAAGLAAAALAAALDATSLGRGLLPVAVAAAAWVLPQLLQAHLRATEQMTATAVSIFTQSLLAYGLGVAAALLVPTPTPTTYWLGHAAGSLLALVAGLLAASLGPGAGRFPRAELRQLLARSSAGLLATASSILAVGLLRPVAGHFGGDTEVAALTVASQYAQLGALVQGVYWSRFGPTAIQAQLRSDEGGLRRLEGRAALVLSAVWATQLALAYPVLRLLAGDLFSTSMLVAAALLTAVPLFNVRYDGRVGIVWRQGSTLALGGISAASLLLTILLAVLIGRVTTPSLIPASLLVARAGMGEAVRHLARRVVMFKPPAREV
jgi:hypothetical protein